MQPRPASKIGVSSPLSERLGCHRIDFLDFADGSDGTNFVSRGGAATIYRVNRHQRDHSKLVQPDPAPMLYSIGICLDTSDADLVALHHSDHLDTLTNLFGRYAVFCTEGGP